MTCFRSVSCYISAICLLMLCACQSTAPSISSQSGPVNREKSNFHVFILAGQSNMAGRGTLPADPHAPHPRIKMLTPTGDWAPATHPIHYDKPAVAGVGLGISFAKQVVKENGDITVGLVPTACGGSPIDTWQPGAYWPSTQSHPYDDAIARAKQAMQTGTLKAILWHQGESDTRPERSVSYEEKLMALITRFRADLNAPNLPFIIGELGQFADKSSSDSWRRVVNAQKTVGEKLPFVYFVASDGLMETKDGIHFETAPLIEFGRRYANQYLNPK